MTCIQQELDWSQQIPEESLSGTGIQQKGKHPYKDLAEVFQQSKSKLVSMKIHPNTVLWCSLFHLSSAELSILNFFYLTLSVKKLICYSALTFSTFQSHKAWILPKNPWKNTLRCYQSLPCMFYRMGLSAKCISNDLLFSEQWWCHC